ncbi:MAG: NfeD family protein, partial [Bdellovibrionales bacterium]|nr:NfeD family protein [Bdellovibrionales bacterium]
METTWIWLALGVGLLIVEMLTGTLSFIFFALAAFVVGATRYFFGIDNWALESVIFAAVGICSLLLLRKKLVSVFHAKRASDYQGDMQQEVILTTGIPAGESGSVEYQGSVWTAINDSAIAMKAGDKAAIVRTEGV